MKFKQMVSSSHQGKARPQEKVTLPTAKQMIGSAFKAGREILAEPTMANEDLRNSRIAACDSCGFMTEEGRCGNTETDKRGCGCFMKVKARFEIMACPRGLWEK